MHIKIPLKFHMTPCVATYLPMSGGLDVSIGHMHQIRDISVGHMHQLIGVSIGHMQRTSLEVSARICDCHLHDEASALVQTRTRFKLACTQYFSSDTCKLENIAQEIMQLHIL